MDGMRVDRNRAAIVVPAVETTEEAASASAAAIMGAMAVVCRGAAAIVLVVEQTAEQAGAAAAAMAAAAAIIHRGRVNNRAAANRGMAVDWRDADGAGRGAAVATVAAEQTIDRFAATCHGDHHHNAVHRRNLQQRNWCPTQSETYRQPKAPEANARPFPFKLGKPSSSPNLRQIAFRREANTPF